MSTHPQIQVFQAAAAALKEERYWEHTVETEREFLTALGDVIREVAYQLDRHHVLDPKAMQAYRDAAPFHVPSFVDTSAEAILMFSLEHRISRPLRPVEDQDRPTT